MTKTVTSDRTTQNIEAEARAWFIDLLQAPTERKRIAFETWQKADPAHAEAFRTIALAWEAAEQPGKRLAEAEADELAVYLRAMDGEKSRTRTTRRLSGLALVLLCLLSAAIWLERPHLFQDLAADYVSPRGERASIRLADGSIVLLDADSALAEDFTAGERRVRLLRGAAFFDVVHNAEKPFVVAAGEGEVRVLGTLFDVRLFDGRAVVTLANGSVSVTAGPDRAKALLKPGEQVAFDDAGLAAVESVNIEDSLAWRNGRFVFYRARLADVVREIERYRPGRIVIASTALANERVTGSFPLDDTDAALASLQASVGFRFNALAGRLTLITP
ncbi:FecR family protein [Shinella sp. HZN7]|uniref:FecR family protein n=1 Tax=Shinella sp. (strain HZN7) TaxID=879274 RepID=UPI0009FD1D11|nr:FecR family protein [Shinella sp. HZN7]